MIQNPKAIQNQMERSPMAKSNDMHVSGQKTREAKLQFRTEGARVKNEDEMFRSNELFEIYKQSNL